MSSRILLSITILCIYSTSLLAQKTKNSRATFFYTTLPQEKLPENFLTYSVSFSGYGLRDAEMVPLDCEKAIEMDAFRKINEPDRYGHLRIVAYVAYIDRGSPEYKNEKHVTKDKETGKETVNYTYWYEIPFSTSISYSIYDPNGELLHVYEDLVKVTSQTRKYGSSKLLSSNYADQRASLKKKFAVNTVNNLIARIQKQLSTVYDFDFKSKTTSFFTIKNHESESEFEQYAALATAELKSLGVNYSEDQLETVRNNLQPAMDFWAKKGQADPFNATLKKKQLKGIKAIYRAAHTNLALMNFYLYDNLEEAAKHANLVIKSEGKDRTCSFLLRDVKKNQALTELHNIYTLHYKRDVSEALGPNEVSELTLKQEAIKENSNTQEATITYEGEIIKGQMAQNKEAKDLSFGEHGNTKFIATKESDLEEFDLTDPKISAFSIGNRNFKKIRFSPCAEGKQEAQIHILELLYKSEKITLYKYYPPAGLADQKMELALQKANQEFPISMYESQFLLWKKGISNYFSDCSDLQELCASGEISQNKDDLMKAARIYAELCQ